MLLVVLSNTLTELVAHWAWNDKALAYCGTPF